MVDPGLTDPQLLVLQVFFDLPESVGFILAGGAALLAVGISARPTDDVDLFTTAPSVAAAGDALEAAADARGWAVERLHDSETFRRLDIHLPSTERVLVDLAQDAGPLSAPTITSAGPTYPPDELAARKVLALFDRAALRDFVDVANLAERYGKETLLELAQRIDSGLDREVLRQMIQSLDRFTDEQIGSLTSEPDAMRRFYGDWVAELR